MYPKCPQGVYSNQQQEGQQQSGDEYILPPDQITRALKSILATLRLHDELIRVMVDDDSSALTEQSVVRVAKQGTFKKIAGLEERTNFNLGEVRHFVESYMGQFDGIRSRMDALERNNRNELTRLEENIQLSSHHTRPIFDTETVERDVAQLHMQHQKTELYVKEQMQRFESFTEERQLRSKVEELLSANTSGQTELRHRVDTLGAQVQALQDKLRDTEQENKVQSEIAKIEGTLTATKNQAATTAADCSTLRDSIDRLTSKVRNMTTELQECKVVDKDAVSTDRLKHKLDNLKTNLENKLNHYDKTINHLQKQLEHTNTKIQSTVGDSVEAAKRTWSSQLKQVESKCQQSSKELLDSKIGIFKKEDDFIKQTTDKMSNRVANIEHAIKIGQTELESVTKQVHQLNTVSGECVRKSEEAQRGIVNASSQITSRLDTEIGELWGALEKRVSDCEQQIKVNEEIALKKVYSFINGEEFCIQSSQNNHNNVSDESTNSVTAVDISSSSNTMEKIITAQSGKNLSLSGFETGMSCNALVRKPDVVVLESRLRDEMDDIAEKVSALKSSYTTELVTKDIFNGIKTEIKQLRDQCGLLTPHTTSMESRLHSDVSDLCRKVDALEMADDRIDKKLTNGLSEVQQALESKTADWNRQMGEINDVIRRRTDTMQSEVTTCLSNASSQYNECRSKLNTIEMLADDTNKSLTINTNILRNELNEKYDVLNKKVTHKLEEFTTEVRNSKNSIHRLEQNIGDVRSCPNAVSELTQRIMDYETKVGSVEHQVQMDVGELKIRLDSSNTRFEGLEAKIIDTSKVFQAKLTDGLSSVTNCAELVCGTKCTEIEQKMYQNLDKTLEDTRERESEMRNMIQDMQLDQQAVDRELIRHNERLDSIAKNIINTGNADLRELTKTVDAVQTQLGAVVQDCRAEISGFNQTLQSVKTKTEGLSEELSGVVTQLTVQGRETRSRLDGLESNDKEIRSSIKDHNQSLKNLNEEINNSAQALQTTQTRVGNFNNDIKALQTLTHGISHEISDARRGYVTFREFTDKIMTQVNDTTSQQSLMSNEIAALSGRTTQMEGRLQQLQEQYSSSIADTRATTTTLNAQVTSLKDQVDRQTVKQERDADTVMQAIQQKFEDSVAECDKRMLGLSNTTKEVKSRLDSNQDSIAELQLTVASSTSAALRQGELKCDELEARLDSLWRECKDLRTVTIKTENDVDEVHQLRKNNMETTERLEGIVSDTRGICQAVSIDNNHLKARIDNLTTKRSQDEGKLHELITKVTEMKSGTSGMLSLIAESKEIRESFGHFVRKQEYEMMIEGLEKRFENVSGNAEQHISTMCNLAADMGAKIEAIDRHVGNIKGSLLTELDSTKTEWKSLHHSDVQALSMRLDSISNDARNLKTNQQKLENNMQEQLSNIQGAQLGNERLELSIQQERDRITSSCNDISHIKNKVEGVSGRISAVEARVTDNRDQMDIVQANVRQVTVNSANEMHLLKASMESSIKKVTSAIDVLPDLMNHKHQAFAQEVSRELSQVQTSVSHAKTQIENLDSSLSNLKATSQLTAEETKRGIDERLDSLKARLDQAYSDIKVSKANSQKLEGQITETRDSQSVIVEEQKRYCEHVNDIRSAINNFNGDICNIRAKMECHVGKVLVIEGAVADMDEKHQLNLQDVQSSVNDLHTQITDSRTSSQSLLGRLTVLEQKSQEHQHTTKRKLDEVIIDVKNSVERKMQQLDSKGDNNFNEMRLRMDTHVADLRGKLDIFQQKCNNVDGKVTEVQHTARMSFDDSKKALHNSVTQHQLDELRSTLSTAVQLCSEEVRSGLLKQQERVTHLQGSVQEAINEVTVKVTNNSNNRSDIQTNRSSTNTSPTTPTKLITCNARDTTNPSSPTSEEGQCGGKGKADMHLLQLFEITLRDVQKAVAQIDSKSKVKCLLTSPTLVSAIKTVVLDNMGSPKSPPVKHDVVTYPIAPPTVNRDRKHDHSPVRAIGGRGLPPAPASPSPADSVAPSILKSRTSDHIHEIGLNHKNVQIVSPPRSESMIDFGSSDKNSSMTSSNTTTTSTLLSSSALGEAAGAVAQAQQQHQRPSCGMEIMDGKNQSVVITAVKEGGAASWASLQEGDRILGVNNKKVTKTAEFKKEIASNKTGSLVSMKIERPDVGIMDVLLTLQTSKSPPTTPAKLQHR